ncbi:MAG: DegT/DnrJ/EryC1/StrS family aminotransferase [Candidatus Pacebacteria bacterium]|nr:DegT/DnrJ/EryC1/StrS family aminotransferase [Candidatus Paceibacterota bacterium]
MSQYFKPISISLSPNVEKDDLKLALKLIFSPWRWIKGRAVSQLEEEFRKYLGVKYAFSFNSGRSALYAILKSLNIGDKSDVLLQAFTCNAAVNPVLWAGLNPVYIDCENNYNLDIDDLKRKITKNAKILMVQHTFGCPAQMDEILKFSRDNNLILIEDCAHSLGAQYNGKKTGTLSKAAFFSFSRDKIISSVYGGMAVTNDDELAKNLHSIQKEFKHPSYLWTLQQLLHPVLLNYIILPIYNFIDLGKIFLVLSQYLGILSKAVHKKEKKGERPFYFPKKMPNALALLALNQFKKLERFNEHRRIISDFYLKRLQDSSFILPEKENNVFLRFSIRHNLAHQIISYAWKKENILIGDWYTTPIAPDDTNLRKMGYISGTCPNAEKLSKTTLNLPTHINISLKDAERIVDFLLTWK